MIRVVCLLVFASLLPLLGLRALAVASGMLCLAMLCADPAALRAALVRLWQLRWLLIATGILYFGFTPGETLWGPLTSEGLRQGAERMLVLAALLLAVSATLFHLPPAELADVLSRLLAPLAALGVPVAAFTRRLALTLDRVSDMRALLARMRTAQGAPAALLAQACEAVETAAQAPAPVPVAPVAAPIPLWHWLLPPTVAITVLGLHWLLP